jgi:3-vinyl bacteriochlorophyllide hydratase
MNARLSVGGVSGFGLYQDIPAWLGGSATVLGPPRSGEATRVVRDPLFATLVDGCFDMISPSPWSAHAGLSAAHHGRRKGHSRPPLYTPEERLRRDATPWTLVQGILAPLQFLVFAVSLGLVVRYLLTGDGYRLATASILLKTALLYTIMITGSIWEKVVFGKYLFARAFFWEDVCSMLVLALQTTYVSALILGWASPRQQMMIAVSAYGVYVVNAAQFVLKLREARLGAARQADAQARRTGDTK